MKSQMRIEFEAWHGAELNDDMDIQTSVAWDNWRVCWRAAKNHTAAQNLDERIRLEIISAKPGDTLFVSSPYRVDEDVAARLLSYIKGSIPAGVKVILLGEDIKIKLERGDEDGLSQ